MARRDDDEDKNPVRRQVDRAFAVVDGGRAQGEPSPRRGQHAGGAPGGGESFVEAHGEESDPPANHGDGPPGSITPDDKETIRACAGLDQNDLGNAQRLLRWSGSELAYVAGMGWLAWRGTHWQRDEGDLLVSAMAQGVVEKIKLEAAVLELGEDEMKIIATAAKIIARSRKDKALVSGDEEATLQKAAKLRELLAAKRSKRWSFAVTSGNRGRTVAMLAQAQAMKAIEPDALDADHFRFNVRNGTLVFWREPDPERPEGSERQAGRFELLKHERADGITKVAEVDYHEEATCPEWLAFLKRVQPKDEMRRFLQVATAYALLVGGNDEQIVLYHFGAGANGKSVFLEVTGDLAGSYRSVVAPESITGDNQKQGQQASPDIARLHNTRLVTVEELPRGQPIKEALIKAASGGSKMVARFLQREFFEFTPIFVAMLSGNDMPQVGNDFGIWRRLKIVPWRETIPDAEQVPFGEMIARLGAERSGILNWLIEGLMLYLAQGLKPFVPDEITRFTDQYRRDRDVVADFAGACLKRVEGYHINAADAFKAFENWCSASGVRAPTQTAFGLRMATLGYEKELGRIRRYLNVQLVNPPDAFEPRDHGAGASAGSGQSAVGSRPPPSDAGDPGWVPT